MNKLLLITGDLAAGKSTFSQILSKRYQVSVFNKDTIKEVLGNTIGFSDRQENLRLSNAAVEMMRFIFSQTAAFHNNLILEANFHTGELEKLHQIADENGYEILTLVLRGELSVLHERYLNRIQNENRHFVHLSNELDVFENFRNYIDVSRKENVGGNVIYIDASGFSYQKDEELLMKIDTFMG